LQDATPSLLAAGWWGAAFTVAVARCPDTGALKKIFDFGVLLVVCLYYWLFLAFARFCEGTSSMATNLAIDDNLIEEARRLGKLKTKKAAINEALLEYVQRHRQMEMLDLFGCIDIDPDYRYKEQRKRS
jgi:hypothetical protein